jgi:flavin reductase (DIM6/NTAB) family NADH-FMN oxidoreductase RutF
MKKIIKQSLSVPLLGEFAPVLVNLIGTCNEDGNPHLCGASFVSFTLGPPKSIVFSTFVKPTINNIERTGEFSVNICTGEMAEISDSIYWKQELGKQNKSIDSFEWGSKVHVPVLNASPFVCECSVLQSYKFGESVFILPK